MIKYIDDEKNKGISDEFIRSKLRKAGWSVDQIKYAMKSHLKINSGAISLFSFTTNKHKKLNKDKNTK